MPEDSKSCNEKNIFFKHTKDDAKASKTRFIEDIFYENQTYQYIKNRN